LTIFRIYTKSFQDYVTRRFNASSAELRSPRALDLRWNRRLTRSPVQLEHASLQT